MKKKKAIPVILMLLAILAMVAFQAYWLRKSYLEERQVLNIKANTLFKEAVSIEQIRKLKLDTNFKWSFDATRNIAPGEVFDADIKSLEPQDDKRRAGLMISVNNVQVKNDSLKAVFRTGDSVTKTIKFLNRPGGQALIQVLRGSDDSKDSIRIADISKRYDSLLLKEKINFSYEIGRKQVLSLSDVGFAEPEKANETTVGFFKPITFVMQITGSNGYILKKLAIPILVSIFLVGITILSFMMMWRSLKQQEKLSLLKNDFVSNITHELKTPIATVGVAIEALKSFNAINDPVRTREYLDISSSEIHRLSLLVDKVLKLSMFENKEITLQKEKFDLLELVQDVLASMKLQFEKHEANISLETIGTNFIIEADKLHITSVVYNLLDNALKYSKGKPEIDVVVKAHQEHVSIAVSDKGIGIAPEYKGKIFDKFFRIPGGDRHNIKGYGLGLSYVNHIVKKHMGFVEVKSEPGKGSTFTAHIPYKEADKIRFDEFRTIRKESI